MRDLFTISAAELREKLDKGDDVVLIDVREPYEVQAGAIPSSVNIPLRSLPGRLAEIPEEREIVVYCKIGERSAHAAHFLRQSGFPEARNLEGGILRWDALIEP